MKFQELWSKSVTIYLYGSIHIGFGAFLMSVLTVVLTKSQGPYTYPYDYLLAVFFATTGLYCLHRLSDLDKLSIINPNAKYVEISSVKSVIKIISYVTLVSGGTLFLFQTLWIQLILAVGAIITYLYSHPIFKRIKKLREFNFLKIFLIAGIWGLVTAFIPCHLNGLDWVATTVLFVERSIFIFALTLPFDARDLEVDKKMKIQTIPGFLGYKNSLNLAIFLLLVFCSLFIYWSCLLGNYSEFEGLVLFATNIFVSILVWFSYKKNDFYHTVILDGMLILQPLIIIFLKLWLN